jgi:hypothetical protein
VLAENPSRHLFLLRQRLLLPYSLQANAHRIGSSFLESLDCGAIRKPGKGHDLNGFGSPTCLTGKLIEGLAAVSYLLWAYSA